MSCRSHGRLAIALVAVAATLFPATGQARRGSALVDAARYLDPDSAVVMVIEPGFLARTKTLAKELSPPLFQVLELAGKFTSGAGGVDLGTTAGWLKAGLDPHVPIAIQLGAIDAAAATAIYDQLREKRQWSAKAMRKIPKTYWRHRVVFRVRSKARARRTMLAFASRAGRFYSLVEKNTSEVAMLFGNRPKDGRQVVDILRKRGYFIVGWVPGLDAYALARFQGTSMIVDVVGTFAGLPVAWKRDQKSMIRALGVKNRPANKSFAATLAGGAAKSLPATGLGIWVRGTQLYDTFFALEQTNHLRELASGSGTGRAVSDRCRDARTLASSGTFSDFSATININEKLLKAALNWGLRGNAGALRAMKVDDDGLLDPTADHGGAMAAAIYVAGAAALRKLPRPSLLKQSLPLLWQDLERCAGGATTVVWLFGWPELLGQFFDDLGSVDARSDELIRALGSAAFAIQSFRASRNELALAGEAAFAESAGKTGRHFLDLLFAPGVQHDSHTTWKGARLWPFSRNLSPSKVSFGVGVQDSSAAWYLGLAHNKNPSRKRNQWLVARGSMPRILGDLSLDLPSLGPAAEFAKKHLSTISLSLELRTATLSAVLTAPIH